MNVIETTLINLQLVKRFLQCQLHQNFGTVSTLQATPRTLHETEQHYRSDASMLLTGLTQSAQSVAGEEPVRRSRRVSSFENGSDPSNPVNVTSRDALTTWGVTFQLQIDCAEGSAPAPEAGQRSGDERGDEGGATEGKGLVAPGPRRQRGGGRGKVPGSRSVHHQV